MSTIINKSKIKCAVFDLDGTLLNTIKTINYYLNLALNQNGLGSIDEAECREFVGDGAVKLIHRALRRLECDNTESFSRVFACYNKAYDSEPYFLTEPYDGVRELIDELKRQGIALAVLSNKPDFAAKATVEHFFPNYFDLVYGAREGIALKPDPASLLATLRELDVTPDETAYIGDSEPDIATAINARVALPISVTWGFRSAERLLAAGAARLASNPLEIAAVINAG